jgi:hypothetical protein
MKKIYIIITLGLFSGSLFGQNSLLEDAAGEGSFKIYQSTISVNTGESAIKATIVLPKKTYNPRQYTQYYELRESINREVTILDDTIIVIQQGQTIVTTNGVTKNPGDTIRRILYVANFLGDTGFTINGIASDGNSNLFSEKKLKPKGEVGIFRTYYGKNDSLSRWDYISIAAGVSAKDVSLIDSDSLFNDPKNETSFGFNVEFNYNRVGSIRSSTSIFGAGLSYENRDNANQLSALEYEVTSTIGTNGSQVATQQSSVQGLNESDYKSNTNTLNLNVDFGVYPNVFNDRLLIAGQLRGKMKEDVNTSLNFGFGFYLADKDVSTKIIGGINIIASDLTGAVSNDPLKERITINLVAGFKI